MTLEQIAQIEEKLQYTFADKGLLLRAFTHSSYANSKRSGKTSLDSNERMAFFGDAILEMVVSQYLFDTFPGSSKGEMSYMRSKLVSSSTLAPVVEELCLLEYLQFLTDSKPSEHLCGDLFEAIICAIYLDGGFIPAKQFVLDSLANSLNFIGKTMHKDSKTLLQEYCQKNKMQVPKYTFAERLGTDNNPIYKCDLFIDGDYMCSGVGSNKKNAEQDAAKKLVTKWRIEDSALS